MLNQKTLFDDLMINLFLFSFQEFYQKILEAFHFQVFASNIFFTKFSSFLRSFFKTILRLANNRVFFSFENFFPPLPKDKSTSSTFFFSFALIL